MKIAIYSRKSKFTGKGESIENQIQMCKDYIEKNYTDATFVVYEDEGFSGGDIDRPQFKKLIKDAKNKKFSALVCYRLDRISRNISDFSNTMELLDEHGISFISIKEHFDTTTPMGRAMMYITSVFAQLERETIAERIRDNMMQLARSGRWLGGNTPTGYESESITYYDNHMKEKKMFKLSPIEEELELVKLTFDKYLEIQSISQLETYFVQNNIKSKHGREMTKLTLGDILKNPVYSIADDYTYSYFDSNGAQIACSKEDFDGIHGIMAYNKKLVKKGKSVKQKEFSEWIVAVGKHQGIIQGKDWVKVQNIINQNSIKAPGQGPSYASMLSGLIRCKKCGSFMRVKYGQKNRKTGESHYYYVCNMKIVSQGQRCSCNNLVGIKTDDLVVEALKNRIQSGFLKSIEENKIKLRDKKQTNKEIKLKIDHNQNAIANLVKQLSENQTSIVSKYIVAEMEQLEKENIDLTNKIEKDTTELDILNLDLLKDSMIAFSENIDKVPYPEKRNLVKALIDKIEWDGFDLFIDFLKM